MPQTPAHIVRRTIQVSLVLTLGVLLAACQQTRVEPAGRDRRIFAGFAFGVLSANLPQQVSVPQAHAAAETVLLDRGYVIEGSGVTRDQARVRARSRVAGREEAMVITSALIPSGVQVRIDAGTFGDEAVSRAILDDMLVRLGR